MIFETVRMYIVTCSCNHILFVDNTCVYKRAYIKRQFLYLRIRFSKRAMRKYVMPTMIYIICASTCNNTCGMGDHKTVLLFQPIGKTDVISVEACDVWCAR